MYAKRRENKTMEKFYIDETAAERSEKYIVKTMAEITELEQQHFNEVRPEIDEKHAKFASDRTKMLTVRKLIAWL